MKTKILVSCAVALLLFAAVVTAIQWPQADPVASEPGVVAYDAAMPDLLCVEGRVIAETRSGLSAVERDVLWRDYGLHLSFEWVNDESGFTYHELEIEPYSLWDKAVALTTGSELAPRGIRPLVELLGEDLRVNWAAPDALILEWAQTPSPASSSRDAGAPILSAFPNGPSQEEVNEYGGFGVCLITPENRIHRGELGEWLQFDSVPEPFPDFDYYRQCNPDGSRVDWADALEQEPEFVERYGICFGNGYADALQQYQTAGSPELSPVTVCVADTGMLLNHPDFDGLLHPSAIDANFRSYRVAKTGERAGPEDEITDRFADNATGLPRQAIRGQPAAHGTMVAGTVARCTEGFSTTTGPVRLLSASMKSTPIFSVSGWKVKTPISSAIKLLAALHEHFPVGDFDPAPDDPYQNTGDVRVVNISASVPKAEFSEAQWKIVANLAGKAAGSLAEDLRVNDRTYVFASGNTAQPEADKPGDMDYVLPAAATMAFDGSTPWRSYSSDEGSNMGQNCVSAPGYAIISATLPDHPNLRYLPESEIRPGYKNFTTPSMDHDWYWHTNQFSATSSATPQVASLAALLYAQAPERDHLTVIQLIRASCGDRRNIAPWGESAGLIDYRQALDWPNYLPPPGP